MTELRTLGELRAEGPTATDWLVSDLLPADGLSLVVSPPKVGKSTLCRCLAVAVATGGQWLGREVRAGTVIHLPLEERPGTVRDHYDALDAPDDGIHVMVGGVPKPGERLTWLRGAIADTGAALVIIDPLQRWIEADSNDYSRVTGALGPLIQLARDASVSLVLIHHSRKAEGGRGAEALGSVAYYGSVDTLVSLRETEHGHREVYARGRDGVQMRPTRLTMDDRGWVGVGGWRPPTRTAAKAPAPGPVPGTDLARAIVLHLCYLDEPATELEVMAAVKGKQHGKRRALRQLVKAGTVRRFGDGKRGSPYRYGFVVPRTVQPLKGLNPNGTETEATE